MRVVIDIEANSLNNPTKIWLVVCKDIDHDRFHIFRNVTDDLVEKAKCKDFLRSVRYYIGHNFLGYDYPVLASLLELAVDNIVDISCDTLIVSKLVDYSRKQGHSIEAYGQEFGLEKINFNDWTKWSKEMEDYCVRDVEINHRVYNHYRRIIHDDSWAASIKLESAFQLVTNSLHRNGFGFDRSRCDRLLAGVSKELETLDKEILDAFPPRLIPIRLITPRTTKWGTLNRSDFRWVKGGDLSDFNGGPFVRCEWQSFNPSSHKQIIEVLRGAGWLPTDKTKTHIETEREINRLKYSKGEQKELDLAELSAKMVSLQKYGWKINEENLATLPADAPAPARLLAKRILLESRRRTLTEWLGLVAEETGRIHGKFYGIGAWTHRMAHQNPNTANIPTDNKLYGKEMRSLWRAPKNRLLVGVDAEGIQLRIFAHYINDKEFTQSLIDGKKTDKTDPHSLNARILGTTRDRAKRFLYAYLLGGGVGKLSEVLGKSREEGQEALDLFIQRYSGLGELKRNIIPADAKRGYFVGLDGRRVPIPGDTPGERKHLAMSGYLQNGEAIIMKRACLKWHDKLSGYNSFLVNFVHDEWQTETPCNVAIALEVAKLQADSLREVGEELKLNCPMAGSYWNEDLKDYTIGTNWSVTH